MGAKLGVLDWRYSDPSSFRKNGSGDHPVEVDIPKDGTQVWQRYTHAPKFSKGFACQSADSEPIAMTLESGHCKLLLPPDGSKFPERWLRETDIPPSQKLAGAGKSASVVSAKSSLDVPDTPSVHTILRSPVRRKAKKNVESLGSIPPQKHHRSIRSSLLSVNL